MEEKIKILFKKYEDYIFHISHEYWGFSVFIMQKDGKSYGRVYQYDNDKSAICLEGLNVNPDCRNLGLGTELQEIRENIGREIGATESYLWVDTDSWMYEWYKRRGYVDWKKFDDEDNDKLIWMCKTL
jgi:N-acetylglutamate synthase-like GNAT family acetyltransferase